MTNTEDITRQEAVEKLGGAEVTGDALDDLFERVDSGELSIDEANRLLEEADTEDMEGAGDAGQDESFENNIPEAADQRGASQGNDQAQGNTKPFRVFDTQEDYQRTFDNAWNKRYGKMMHEQEARSAEHNALLSDLGALLGVAPEQAAGELNRRRLLLEAQQQGNESPETYAALKTVEQERDNLKQQMETQRRQERARAIVDDIRRRGAEIGKADPAFDVEQAMEDPKFANMVLTLYGQMPERALEVAYRTFYPGGAAGNSAAQGKAMRPMEGALGGRVNSERKPTDFSKMSDKEILDIQNRVLRGEKVDI